VSATSPGLRATHAQQQRPRFSSESWAVIPCRDASGGSWSRGPLAPHTVSEEVLFDRSLRNISSGTCQPASQRRTANGLLTWTSWLWPPKLARCALPDREMVKVGPITIGESSPVAADATRSRALRTLSGATPCFDQKPGFFERRPSSVRRIWSVPPAPQTGPGQLSEPVIEKVLSQAPLLASCT